MTPSEEALAELDRAFSAPNATMRADDYKRKREELQAQAFHERRHSERVTVTPPPAPPAPQPAAQKGAAQQPKFITDKVLFAVVEAIAGEVREFVNARLAPITAELATLREQLAEAKAAPFEFTGVWIEGKAYRRGQFATKGGSLWHCNQATTTQPGDGSGAWTLAVQRGRDARDR
jgi:hypothetical protein